MSGEWNVSTIARGLTAKQFIEWEHYARLEPFNELRDDYRAASIVSMLYNVNRGKGQKQLTLQEALLKWEADEPKRQQSWQEMQKMAYLIATVYNAPGVTV